jgi:UDP-3-O-[3-hydroxymyristoyl] glucosamine N-acyltransferase
MASIRAHRESNTLIITKNSSYTRPIAHRVNLILGINARCMEQVAIDGSLELGKNAQITGNVWAKKAILGPGSIIYGDLTVDGDLTALDKAKVVGHVLVVGGAFIRPGVRFGSLDVGGLIEIQGKPPSQHIKGKMVVNDDMDYPEAPKKSESEAFKKPKEKQAVPPKAPPPKASAPKKAAKGKQPPAQKKKKG